MAEEVASESGRCRGRGEVRRAGWPCQATLVLNMAL
jgi:hypothetical protein